MTTYWSGLDYAHKYINHLTEILTDSELSYQYTSILYQLQHELGEIEHHNSLLMVRHGATRQRKGIINGVGYLANTLFGVLDDRFLQKYQQDIDNIQGNRNHLTQLLKNQTSVIEAQNNILHLSAQIILSGLRNIPKDLLDTISDIWQGHMDSYILPREQLQTDISIISGHLPTEMELPADKNDITEYYKVMKMNAKMGSKYMVIEVKLPLLSKESFQIDELISLPVNGFITEINTQYIAFNLQKDLLIPLSDTDLRSCLHISRSE
ncbi:unnamed protein product [Leptosia nina]|uniref:Uncharacterized protein n=1 Tax=Leptosia nina TaxID=320188 RepID=A0AAV1K1U6_9NEOP